MTVKQLDDETARWWRAAADKYTTRVLPNGHIFTTICRLSFPTLVVARAGKGATSKKTPHFAATLLFPMHADLSVLIAGCHDAGKAKFGAEWEKAKPPKVKTFRWPIRDQGEKAMDGYVDGAFFVAARTNDAEPIPTKDRNGETITRVEDIYGGCFVLASIRPYAYSAQDADGQTYRGVSVGLQGIQKVAEGPKFGGRPSAEGDFAPVAALNEPFAASFSEASQYE